MKQGVIWGVTCGALWALTACSSAVHDSPPAVAQPMPGKVTTFVGDGTQGFDGDGHAPLDSWLDEATELGFAADGTLYIDDWNSHRIRCVTAQGTLGTMVGSSFPGDWPPSTALTATVMGDTLAINHPMDLAFEANQKILIAGWHNHKLFELDPNTDSVRVLAGGNKPGYSGDGAAAQGALLNFPSSIVIAADGGILFADQRNNVVRRLAPDAIQTISTVVGVKAPAAFAGDGAAAAQASLALAPYNEAGGSDNPPPGGMLALDADQNLYISDTFNHCIRRVSAGSDGVVGAGDPSEETIDTVVGTCGSSGFSPDGDAKAIQLDTPRDIEINAGMLFIADSENHLIWRVDLQSGHAEHWVGTGKPGNGPEGADPLSFALDSPYGIGFDAQGDLLIADTLNNRIRILWQ
jgi:hypothetical protein